MNSKEREVMEQWLEAYLCREMPPGTVIGDPKWWVPKIANAIKEALSSPNGEAQPEQRSANEHLEPVATVGDLVPSRRWNLELPEDAKLYTNPPQRTAAVGEGTRRAWVGLTDEEYFEIGQRHWLPSSKVEQIYYEIEAKLKAKNERLEKNT